MIIVSPQDGQQRALRNSVHEVNNTVLGRIIEKKKKGITRSYGIQSKKIKKPITRHASLGTNGRWLNS